MCTRACVSLCSGDCCVLTARLWTFAQAGYVSEARGWSNSRLTTSTTAASKMHCLCTARLLTGYTLSFTPSCTHPSLLPLPTGNSQGWPVPGGARVCACTPRASMLQKGWRPGNHRCKPRTWSNPAGDISPHFWPLRGAVLLSAMSKEKEGWEGREVRGHRPVHFCTASFDDARPCCTASSPTHQSPLQAPPPPLLPPPG